MFWSASQVYSASVSTPSAMTSMLSFKASQTIGAHDGLARSWALRCANEAHVEFDLVRLKVGEKC